jgi:flagellar hook assembly protein FlgD
MYEAGEYSVVWNGTDDSGSNVGSGVYFYRMHAGEYSTNRKMILMK